MRRMVENLKTVAEEEIIRLKPSFGRKLNPDGLSPLHLALEKGHLETVRRLKSLTESLYGTLKRQALNSKDEEGNTVLHAAVAASKPEGNTALDVAEGLQTGDAKTTIENILLGAGALQRLLSRQRTSPDLFNIVLVVAVLIATATFQAVLSPSGGGGSGGNNLLTNGSNINATVSFTNNNLPASNVSLKSYIATIFTPPDNSIERVPMKDPHGRGLKLREEITEHPFYNPSFILAKSTSVVGQGVRVTRKSKILQPLVVDNTTNP
ncbi:hypothetical protein Acr_14g0007660 [Actinidia rufa]|uniref:Ankyrin repeat family protein n=1 Tax=Actinidia rufa TaxID=165716 RepID=A0A7J0FR36_9ERIC|nr:hypothetical protein Acr_14g0007660 [Actinidia rufa]